MISAMRGESRCSCFLLSSSSSSSLSCCLILPRSFLRSAFVDRFFCGRRRTTSNRHSLTRRYTGKSLFPTISSDGRAELRSFRTAAAFALDPLSVFLFLFLSFLHSCFFVLAFRNVDPVECAITVYLHPCLFFRTAPVSSSDLSRSLLSAFILKSWKSPNEATGS